MNNNSKQLSLLSDEKLLDQTKTLVQKERNINFQIIRHLEEIEARKLYLSRGFSSLFDYAIKELGYSGSAACRRIKAMELCKEVPEVEAKLKSGKLNLTTALQLQQFFKKTKVKSKNQSYFNFKSENIQTNKKEDKDSNTHLQTMSGSLNLENLEGSKNFQETENVKSIQQTECNKETQKSILNKSPDNKNLMIQDCHLNKTQKINLIKKVEGKSSREVEKILTQLTNKDIFLKERVRYVNANKIKMNITVHEKCLTNLEKLKHLLSHKNPNMCYGDLLYLLSEIALEKHDPKRRYERRFSKKENNLKQKSKNILLSAGGEIKSESNSGKTVNEKNTFQKQKEKSLKVSDVFQKRKTLRIGRYIPAQVRDYVWTRDKGQCTYVCSKTYKKCSSKHLLQVDHIQPFSLGGSHSSKNLRLLCAFHNQYRNRMNDNKKNQTLSF